MNEAPQLELVDLGDAKKETKGDPETYRLEAKPLSGCFRRVHAVAFCHPLRRRAAISAPMVARTSGPLSCRVAG